MTLNDLLKVLEPKERISITERAKIGNMTNYVKVFVGYAIQMNYDYLKTCKIETIYCNGGLIEIIVDGDSGHETH